jgi:serine/threonine protein kinase
MAAADEIQERATRRVGRVLGERWRLERLLGVGGMASVYAAKHTNNQRGAAIKLLHRELSVNESTRRRFLREGYIANKVAHPGAVSIVDDGVDEDGSVFLVLELLEGETLQARAQKQDYHMDPRELLKLAVDLLDVLAVAHAAQVIHRDLKPENIFLTDDGAVKVLDFGIARLNEPRGDLTTQMGAIVGTPTYMPPEQVAGRMEEIDARTDIWAVGAILFTCYSGRFVHEANQATALLYQAMTQPAPKLADIVHDVPPAFAAVVDRALAFEREARWPDARAMQAAVREALGSEGSALRESDSRTSLDSSRKEVPFAETVALGPGQAKALATGPGVGAVSAVSSVSSGRMPIVTPAHGPSQTEFGIGLSQSSPSAPPEPVRRSSRRSLTTALVAFLVGLVGAFFVWRRRGMLDQRALEAGLSELFGAGEPPANAATTPASDNGASAEPPSGPSSLEPSSPPPPSDPPAPEALAAGDLDAGEEDDDGGEDEDDDGGEDEEEEEADAGAAPSSLTAPAAAGGVAASFARGVAPHKVAAAPTRKAPPPPATRAVPKKRKKKRRRKGPVRR